MPAAPAAAVTAVAVAPTRTSSAASTATSAASAAAGPTTPAGHKRQSGAQSVLSSLKKSADALRKVFKAHKGAGRKRGDAAPAAASAAPIVVGKAAPSPRAGKAAAEAKDSAVADLVEIATWLDKPAAAKVLAQANWDPATAMQLAIQAKVGAGAGADGGRRRR